MDNGYVKSISPLQFGFQPGLSFIMCSFMVRDEVHYAKELGSNVFSCFMDARKAFYVIWHDGLFYKLHELGLKGPPLCVIMDMYDNMKCCVLDGVFFTVILYWFNWIDMILCHNRTTTLSIFRGKYNRFTTKVSLSVFCLTACQAGLSVCLSVCLLFDCLSAGLSLCLPFCPSVWLCDYHSENFN